MTSASAPFYSLRQTLCHASQASSLVLMGWGSKLLKTSNLQRFTKVFTFVFLFVFWPYTAWAQSFTYNSNGYATLEAVFADISGTGNKFIYVNDDDGTLGGVCTIADGQTVRLVSSASGTQRTITRNASTAQISIASGGTLLMTDIILDGGSTAATPITASVALLENASTRTLQLDNCKFQNCKRYEYSASSTNGIDQRSRGGGLFSSVNLTISGDAIFSNCSTELEADHIEGLSWPYGGIDRFNGSGGGIFSMGYVYINGNARFTDCSAKASLEHISNNDNQDQYNGCGGGIHSGGIHNATAGYVSITKNAEFTRCTANYVGTGEGDCDSDSYNGCGGGIFAPNDFVNIGGNAVFTDCSAEANVNRINSIRQGYLGCGGGICALTVRITKATGTGTFTNCHASANVINKPSSNIYDCGNGGAIALVNGTTYPTTTYSQNEITITNCSADFSVNSNGSSCGAGGGVFSFSTNYGIVFYNNVSITSCTAKSGGGIYCSNTVDLRGNTANIENNVANSGGGIVGGVIITNGTNSISNNEAISGSGGGIAGHLTINGGTSSINNNTATQNGGGIFGDYKGINVNGGTLSITNNSAQNGGGIYQESTSSGFSSTIDNTTISHNTAVRGGGIYINGSQHRITLLNSTISNNTATQQGGGLFSQGANISIAGNNNISNNSATRQGGGICITKQLYVLGLWEFSGTNTISGNTAGNYQDGDGGGGIYIQGIKNTTGTADDDIPVLLDGVTISDNTAYGRGGGLYVAEEGAGSGTWKGPSVLVRDCTITGNMAKANPSASTHDIGNGGGIYAHGSKLAASNPYTDGYLKVIGGTIAGNQALRNGCPLDHYCIGNGGGVYAYSGTVMLSGVNIGEDGNANSANRNGGGVFVNEHADVTLNGATDIAYNTAVNGAGIYTLGNLTVDGSTFTVSNNTATGYGGGINVTHADVNDPEEIGFLGTMSYSVDPSDPSFVNPGVFNYRIYNSSNTLVGDFPFDNDDYEDLLAPGTYTVRLSKTDGISDFSSLASLTLAISDIDGSITPNGGAPIANETDITFTTFTDGYEICTFEVTSPADLGGTLTMSNGATLSSNSATYGGGLFIGSHTTAHLQGSTIGGSTADKNSATKVGGGIYKLGTLMVEGTNTVTDNKSGTAKAIVTDNVYIPTTAAQPYVLVSDELDCGSSIGITKTKTDHSYADDDNYTEVRTVVATNETLGSGHAFDAYKRNVFFDDTDTYGVWSLDLTQSSHDDYDIDNCYFIETWRNFANASGFTGSGPYEVSSAAGLAYLAQQVNGGTDYAGAVINQTADLDLSGHYWEPIGISDNGDCGIGDNAFAGTFNGNGHFVAGAKAVLPFKDNGLFGNVSGTVKHVFAVDGEYQGSYATSGSVGGIVGKTTGLIDGCEASGITLTGVGTDVSAGGIAGTVASGGEVRNSFAVDNTTALGASGSIASAGALAGSIASGGAVRNSYAKSNTLVGTAVGALVGNNGGTLSNCYSNATTGNLVGTGTAGSNVYAAGATGATYTYTATIGADNLGYMYADNTVNGVAMFKQLNTNATALGAGYAQWARPGLTEINGDLPVLMLDAYNGSTGGFSSVGTYGGSADVLQYGGTARDSDQVNTALTRTGTGTNCLFIYGDVTTAPTTAAASYTQSKVSVYEHASILRPGTLKDYGQTYVGVTFDNAAADAGVGAMSTDYMNDLGGQSLKRDWHMFSTPLAEVPLGFDYTVSGSNTNKNTYSSGNTGTYYNNPWTNAGTEFSWITAGTHRYWMRTFDPSDPKTDGYFPTTVDGTIMTQTDDLFVTNSDECPSSGTYRYPYGMDLYCWTEPDYHWINFKRNGPNHWSSEEPHNHIDYFGQGTNINEDNLLQGKGYLASIATATLMQSHGSLNSGTALLSKQTLTKNGAKCTGWNLVGNPFHAYLSFDQLASANAAVLGTEPLYVVYEAEGFGTSGNGTLGNGYLYYPYTGSPGGAYARPYLHPHQGFFVFAENEGKLTFNENTMTMSRATVGANGNFRENKMAYPLVNLFLSSDKGCADVCVVEFNRPEWGGAYKQKALRMGNGQLYAYHDGNEYAALFATAEAQRIPIYFEPKESDTYTLHWNTANGDFSQLFLVDNLTGVQYDMIRNDSYSFSGNYDDYKSRFYLCFAVVGMDEFEDDTSPGGTTFAFHDGSQWVVTGGGQLDLIDLQGRVLHRATLGEGGQTRVSLPDVAKGMYLLRRSDANGTHVQKIIIK